MGVYKKLKKSDVLKSNFKVYRDWNLNQSSDGITSKQYFSGSDTTSGSYAYSSGSLWNSLCFNFYLSSSESDQNSYRFPEWVQGASTTTTVIHRGNSIDQTTDDRMNTMLKEESFSLGYPRIHEHHQHLNKFGKNWISGSVISISQKIFGDGIKPGTFELTDNSTSATIKLKDDKRGNIYAVDPPLSQSNNSPSSSTNHIGNIFYTLGVVVLKETSSYSSGNYYSRVATNNWRAKFKSTISTTTSEYILRINPSEFNITNNPTVFNWENTGSGYIKPSLSTGSFNPYITTVGLYDEYKNLVMVGKLSKPIKKSRRLPLTLKIIYDY